MSEPCPCDDADEWCQALVETGYPFCARCREHHRHPETCGGITVVTHENAPRPEGRGA